MLSRFHKLSFVSRRTRVCPKFSMDYPKNWASYYFNESTTHYSRCENEVRCMSIWIRLRKSI